MDALKMINPMLLQAVSFVLFLVALPLISFGTMEEQAVIWWVGLVLIVIAGLLPPLGHFVPEEEDEGDEAEEGADQTGGEEADEGDSDSDDERDSDADDDGGETGPPSAGPIGRGAGSTGREPDRARVEEQQDRARQEDKQ